MHKDGQTIQGTSGTEIESPNSPDTHQSAPVSQRRPRMLVPDAARGFALLGIAIANIATAWLVAPTSMPAFFFGGITSGATALVDKIAVVFAAITSHNRGLPMFATLLGFGVGLITLSLNRRGFTVSQSRRVLIKRYAYLALFGMIHTVFLFFGDVMFLYGICGIVIALLIGFRDRTLTIVAWVPLILSTLFGLLGILLLVKNTNAAPGNITAAGGSTQIPSYAEMLAANLKVLGVGITTLPVSMFFYFPVMLLGFVWARKGVLADVNAHRTQLKLWLAVAIVISLGVGLPWGLSAIDVLPSQYEKVLLFLNTCLGAFTGPGILAGLALLLEPVQRRINEGAAVPAWMTAVVALGKRSMTGYLLQSVLFFILVYPFMLGIPRGLGAAAQTGIAIVVWLLTLAIAWALEVRGLAGPFEKVHRRLSYGPTMRPEK